MQRNLPRTSLAVVALLLSGIAAFDALRPGEVELAPVEDPLLASIQSRLDELAARSERLASQVEELARRPPGSTGAERAPARAREAVAEVDGDAAAALEELAERLSRLEHFAERVGEGADANELIQVLRSGREDERAELEREAIASYQARVLDPDAPASDKLEALGILRRFSPASDARSAAVVDEALRLFDETDDPALRADLLRSLDGVRSDTLRRHLLGVLADEGDGVVRAEAVETLGPIARVDASVRAVLEDLARNDPDPAVRKEARDALEDLAEED